MRKKFLIKIVSLNLLFVFMLSFNIGNIMYKSTLAVEKDNNIKKVYIGGEPVGIKIKTKGVLVIGVNNIETENGIKISPAIKCGIQIGDNILSIENNIVKDAEDLYKVLSKCSGKKLKLNIERKNKDIIKYIEPLKSIENNSYRLGMIIREGSSGIGTMTYYDIDSKVYGALGHGISDYDTGYIIKLGTGFIASSEITNVKRSIQGTPGELRGIFKEDGLILGNIYSNTPCGIFGKYDEEYIPKKQFSRPIEVAEKSDIKLGKAYIYTTILGEKPELYQINIEKLNTQDNFATKNMQIKVTDKKLLSKTGGIVQGMSGSPIIQDNKLVGAVTHVMINRPQYGYGIYIDWMIKESNNVK